MNNLKLRQDIDALVGDILEHPERARELQRAIRDRLAADGEDAPGPKLRIISGGSVPVASEPDDLWDNVPV